MSRLPDSSMNLPPARRTMADITALFMSGAGPAPGNPTKSAEMLERSGKVEILEGLVKQVDPGAGTLQVTAGPLGNRILEVAEDTQ